MGGSFYRTDTNSGDNRVKIVNSPIPDVKIIELDKLEDERGYFARTWCQNELADEGISMTIAQCNLSYNEKAGTLRGMHYQIPPYAEIKIVSCTRGKIFDVAVDLRPNSKTFRQYFGIELSADNKRQLLIPEGFAHGFLTLVDQTEIYYLMSEFYHPEASRGLRWNDPAFDIIWPENVIHIKQRDETYPDFNYDNNARDFKLL
jgi:dTDP-4-dehydrorhamnose 3,5-epimerase